MVVGKALLSSAIFSVYVCERDTNMLKDKEKNRESSRGVVKENWGRRLETNLGCVQAFR